MREILLTVAVAAFQVEPFLAQTLDSLSVNCGGLEVLVIDDGSTDRTAEIAKRYETRDPGIFRYVRKENGGWGSVINTAVRMARGKYFRQLDGDDFLKTENLSGFLAYLKDARDELIVTPYEEIDDGTQRILRIHSWGETEKASLKELMERPEFGIWACTFRTDFLRAQKIRLLEHCFYTDVEFLVASCLAVERIGSWDGVIYRYRTGREGQSVSVSGARKNYKQHLRVVWRLCQLFEQAPEEKRNQIITRIRFAVLQQYRFFFYLSPTKEHKKELLDFDRELKRRSGLLYDIPNRQVRLMRRVHFWGYGIAAVWIVCRKQNRRRK